MKSDEQILQILDEVRKHGTVTFISDNPKHDRAKLYRERDKQKAMHKPLPFFPNIDDIKTHVDKKDRNKITVSLVKEAVNDPLIFVQTPEKPQAPAKPKRVRKKPDSVIKAEIQLERLEGQLERAKDDPQMTPDIWQHWKEYIDTQRIAMEYFMDTRDDDFIDVYRPPRSEDFNKYVMLAFYGVKIVEEPKLIVTNRDKLEALVQRKGEYLNDNTSEGQRMLASIDNELERLRKLIDLEDSNKPPL